MKETKLIQIYRCVSQPLFMNLFKASTCLIVTDAKQSAKWCISLILGNATSASCLFCYATEKLEEHRVLWLVGMGMDLTEHYVYFLTFIFAKGLS